MSLKIIDCFIFYNELELLTYRLNILNNVVDYFVIVESTHTFIGKEKKLFFNDNKILFDTFKEKIIHIIVDDFPHKYPHINLNENQQWMNEYFQRNSISRGLDKIHILDTDLLIISDLDEIPDPRTLVDIRQGNIVVIINSLEMDLYYYNLNTKLDMKWYHCKIISYEKYKEITLLCNEIRMLSCPVIQNGGWHLSYFGDSTFIANKISNFSHQEYNSEQFTDLLKIEERVHTSRDVYDRIIPIECVKISENKYLPIEYNKYLLNFSR